MAIRMFASVNCLVGFMLLSSNSAHPMMNLKGAYSHANNPDSLRATKDIRPLRSSVTNTPYAHINQRAGTPSLEKELVDSDVAGQAGAYRLGTSPIDWTQQKAGQNLENEVDRLMAEIQSLDKAYPEEKVDKTSLAKNRDKSSLAQKQETSSLLGGPDEMSWTMDQGTSNFMDIQDTEPLLKHQVIESPLKHSGKPSSVKRLIKTMSNKLHQLNKSPEFRHREYFKFLALLSKHAHIEALKSLNSGNKQEAVEWMQTMQANHERASVVYKAYQRDGHGTIDLKKFDAYRLLEMEVDELKQTIGQPNTT